MTQRNAILSSHAKFKLNFSYLCRSWFARFSALIILWMRRQLRRLHDRLAPPELVVTEHLTGFWRSAALMAAVELRLADQIGERTLNIQTLAQTTQCEPDALARLLQPLASLGFFAEGPKNCWSNTRLSAALRHSLVSDDRNGGQGPLLGSAARFQLQVQWRHWQQLAAVVRSGLPAAALAPEAQHHANLFAWLDTHPVERQLFHQAMESVTSLAKEPLLQAFPWHKYPSIIDLGGGTGQFLRGLPQNAHPGKRAVLDLAHSRPDYLPAGITFVCKSFFELDGELEGYDLIILKHVLHDWNDSDCVSILKQVCSNMESHAKLVVIETVRDAQQHDLIASFADLEMMQSFQSRERTQAEFKDLFEASGLEIKDVVHTLSVFKILVASKNQTV